MADDILTKKRITEYEETATISTLRSDDVMYVDGQTLGTRKMSLLPILNNLFKSSGVSVTDANYSTTITDVNSQPVNTIYTYAANLQSKVSNLPSNFAVTILHFTPIFQASTAPGQVMLAIERTGDNKSLYFRTTSGSPAAWSAWQKVTNESDVEDAITEALNNFSVEISDLKADFSDLQDDIDENKELLEYTKAIGTNKLNPDTITHNSNIGNNASVSNYGQVISGTYDVSDYIDITGADTVSYYYHADSASSAVSKGTMFRIAQYDSTKTVISVSENWVASPFTLSSGVKYIRIVIQPIALEMLVFNSDTTPITYEPYSKEIEYNRILNIENSITNVEGSVSNVEDTISSIVDDTLTANGKAADAKVTGDLISEIEADVNKINNELGIIEVKGINRLNPDTITAAMNISNNQSASYGELVPDANYKVSDYIEVNGGTVSRYYNNNLSSTVVAKIPMFRVGEYDANKNVIKVSENWALSPYALTDNTRYIRVVIQNQNYLNEIVLNYEDVSQITYTPYNDYETSGVVGDVATVKEAQENFNELLGYEISGTNKYNPLTVTSDVTISNDPASLGVLVDSSYYVSDYIPAHVGDVISYYANINVSANWVQKSTFHRIAEYDKDKKCLSVTQNWPSTPYTVANDNTAFVRTDINKSTDNTIIMVTVNVPNLSSLLYEPYEQNKRFKEFDKIKPEVHLVLPLKVPCVINMPLYVYNKAISYGCNDDKDVVFSYNNIKYTQWHDRIKIIKTSEGTSDQAINIFGEDNQTIANGSFSVVAINPASHGQKSATVLIIGDSKTEARYKGNKLKELIDADSNLSVTFVGTQQSGNIVNEGYSGKSIVDLCRTASYGTGRPNIFYNSNLATENKFDFSQGVAQFTAPPDIVFIDHGANNRNIEWETSKGCYDFVIASIHAYDPNIKIVINVQEGPSLHLKANNSDTDYTLPTNFVGKTTSQLLIAEYDNREDENIYILPQYMAVDPMLDYPICDLPVSEVNQMLVPMCVDVIHPGINTSVWNSSTAYKTYDWIRRDNNGEIYGYACIEPNTGHDPLTDDGTYWSKCKNANAGYYKIAYMYYYMLWYLLTRD